MRFFQRVLCLLRLSKKYLRSFQRVLCLLRLNNIIVAFFSAGTLPAADKIKVLCVSFKIIEVLFSGCFACCGQNKSYRRFFQRVLCLLRLSKTFAFFSAGALLAATKSLICVSFSGSFACCASVKKYLRSFQRVLCLLREKKSYMRFFQRVLCLLLPNKIIFAFRSAGTLPAADKIKVLCVSFSGCFACCGSIK